MVPVNITARAPCASLFFSVLHIRVPPPRVPGVSRERKKGTKVEDLYETISTIGKGSGESLRVDFGPIVQTVAACTRPRNRPAAVAIRFWLCRRVVLLHYGHDRSRIGARATSTAVIFSIRCFVPARSFFFFIGQFVCKEVSGWFVRLSCLPRQCHAPVRLSALLGCPQRLSRGCLSEHFFSSRQR